MSIEKPTSLDWKTGLQHESRMVMAATPIEAVHHLEKPEIGTVFLEVPQIAIVGEPHRGFGRIHALLESPEKRKNYLLKQLQPVLAELEKSGRKIIEISYSRKAAEAEYPEGGWHEDDPYAIKPSQWIRVLITTEGTSTEYQKEDGTVLTPKTGVVSIHKGSTVHRGPAQHAGRIREQLMVEMASAENVNE